MLEADRFEMIRGQCLHAMSRWPDSSIDAFVTDPPYGIGLVTSKGERITGDRKMEARRLWQRWVPEAHRLAKPDTAHLVFGSWRSPWMLDILAKHFEVKGCIAWNKRRFGHGYYIMPQ